MKTIRQVLVLAGLALAACSEVPGPIDPVVVIVALSPDSISLNVGQALPLTAIVTGSTQAPSYTSSNTNVAAVDANGVVTGATPGVAFVRASVGDARDSSKVVVVAPVPPPPPPITLNVLSDSFVVTVNATRTLQTVVTGTEAKPTFASSNNNVATVDVNGLITANNVGTAFVTASLGALRDSAKVIVQPASSQQPIAIPTLGSAIVAERHTAEVAAFGNLAYTTTWGNKNGLRGNALKVWNVAGNTPILVDSVIIPGVGTVSDVQISDDGSLLVTSLENSSPNTLNGIAIYNRTTPKPTLITHFTPLNARAGVHTLKLGRVNGRHYAFLSVNSPALMIVDITNPAAPVEVLNRTMGLPFIHDVFIRDGILFTALWNDGMTIWDVGGAGRGGSPQNPVQVGNVRTVNGSVHNIWWFHDPRTGSKKYAFIGEEGPASLFTRATGDVHVVDVSDMSNPREVAFFRPDSATSSTGFNPSGAHNFDMDEESGILYASFYNGGVRALDVRGDLETCTAAQKSADGRCNLRLMGREVGIGLVSTPTFVWGVKMVGNALYASDMRFGIHKLDISALKR